MVLVTACLLYAYQLAYQGEYAMKKNNRKLTKKLIESLDLPQKSPVFFWDTEVKGFGLKLNPTSKVFVVQSRINCASKRVKIGNYGALTVDQARKKAQQTLADMANGRDPIQERRTQQAKGITLEEVARSYINDRTLKKSSIHDINKHLNNAFKDWKKRPIVEINRDMVLKLFREKSDTGPAQANQAFRNLRALLNYAMETYRPGNQPIILENPVNVLSGAKVWNRIEPKNRRIPLNNIGAAWIILEKLYADPFASPEKLSMVAAILFCLLTGARWSEAQTLKWCDVNLKDKTWKIVDPKNTKPVTLPLNSQAQAILEDRPQVNEFVFSSGKSKTGHIGPGRMITDQISTALNIEISPHDLRRSFRAIAAELDIELWRTKLLMNHTISNDVTISAYTEKHDLEYLRPSIQAIGDWIERQGKIASTDNVLDINSKRQVG